MSEAASPWAHGIQHIAKVEAKARRRMAILRKLAGTTWGASEKILKTVYQETVRPHLEYGSTAWSTTAKTNQQALDKVQNQALLLITGAMRSTPITEMERLTGVQLLGQRRDAKNMMQAEKFKCLTNHPMKTRLEGLTKNRLKRSSFVHESKKLSRQFHVRLPQSTLPFFPPDMSEPGVTDITDIKVHTTIPSLSDRLVGLVVRCPPRERKTPSSNPACKGIFRGRVIPVTQKLALQWLPCQAPDVIGSALGLVGPVSVYCDWVR